MHRMHQQLQITRRAIATAAETRRDEIRPLQRPNQLSIIHLFDRAVRPCMAQVTMPSGAVLLGIKNTAHISKHFAYASFFSQQHV